MKAIVTGGTGFLGSHLIEMLLDEGCEVISFSRQIKEVESKLTNKLSYRAVDITNDKQLTKVFESVDVVFHCAALSSVWGSKDSFYKANVEGTRNILQCCEKFNVSKLIYVSSTSIYFDYQNKTNIKESDPITTNFANDYAKTKYLGEQVVLNEKKKVEVNIIRPRGIIGDGDKSIMPRILKVTQSGYFPLINNGQAMVDITYVKNVAYALLLCSKTAHIDKEIFNISNDQPMTVKTLLNLVLQNKKVRFLNAPYQLLTGLASLLEITSKALRLNEPKLTKYGIGLLSFSQTLNIDKAKNVLNYKPIYTIEHAIEQYLKWENNNVRNI